MRTPVLAAALACLSVPAFAAEPMPAAAVIHTLVAQGWDVRSLEQEGDIYHARIRTSDGRLVKIGVSAEGKPLVHAFVKAKAERDRGPADAVDAAQAIAAAAYVGHWDVHSVDYRHGVYLIDAHDDQGVGASFKVRAADGDLREVIHEVASR